MAAAVTHAVADADLFGLLGAGGTAPQVSPAGGKALAAWVVGVSASDDLTVIRGGNWGRIAAPALLRRPAAAKVQPLTSVRW